ncbi:MAG: glycosyl hydrolase [Acidimicrobiales bacterium]
MPLRRLLSGFLITVLVALLLASVSSDSQANAGSGSTMGVFLGGGSKNSSIDKYERWFGGDVGVVVHFLQRSSWADADETLEWVLRVRKSDNRRISLAVPMLVDTGGTLAQGAAGKFDANFKNYAKKLVAGGQKDAIIRLGWESDGKWYRWSAVKDPANFKKYFQRIVKVMRSVPGQNFSFDWNTAINTQRDPSRFYPGDSYVDIVSLDVYDRSYGAKTKDPVKRFASMKSRPGGLNWLKSFAASHKKEMAIPEWGLSRQHVAGVNPDNPVFIKGMYGWIVANKPLYFSYFERNGGDKHALMGGQYPKSAAVFKQLFGGLGGKSSPTNTTSPTTTTAKPASTVGSSATSAPTVTTAANAGSYPTDIDDATLVAERKSAAVEACRAARSATSGSSAKKKNACRKAAIAANRAKRQEQVAIIKGLTTAASTTQPSSTPAKGGGAGIGEVATASGQFTLLAENLTQTASLPATASPSGPSDWRSPVNYQNGTVYLKYEAIARPSADPLKVQVCFWRNSQPGVRDLKYATCSSTALLTVRTAGTSYVSLGSPSSWWKGSTGWDWTKGYDEVRVVHKFTKNGRDYLPMESGCGSSCLGSDAKRMTPIDFRVEAVVVKPNTSLKAPSGWSCPSAWSCN